MTIILVVENPPEIGSDRVINYYFARIMGKMIAMLFQIVSTETTRSRFVIDT